ncbi:MAG TPA: GWxTD domain-containing protein [Pyrinomonadaceae bacterium]|nr:GWxTD domain-containing protein [Pyrinomonadaceae bacterium]
MFKKPGLCFVVLTVSLLLVGLFTAAQAQATKSPKQARPAQQNQNPDEKPRKIKVEPDDAYTRWINEDVSQIITNEERAAYAKLKTNEEREQFIHIFWDNRDPTPDTEENEYRDEHYERVAYANEHFASGVRGSNTDRGRIYIKFGKPDEIESHPAGGPYQRMSYEGGGTTTTVPFEKWFYRHIPGVRSGVEIEFVDPSGSGEYRIARDFSEKDANAHVPGYVPPADVDGGYVREQDSFFSRQALRNDLEKAPEIAPKVLALMNEPKLDENPLNFDIRADYFKLSDNRVIAAFTVQTENRDLVFIPSGGLQTAKLNIVGRIVNLQERRVGAFEDILSTSATAQELTEARNRRSAYSKVVILAPGHYKVDIIVRDTESGAAGIRHLGIDVPKYEDDKLATSSMILAARLENMDGREASSQFVIGQTKVIPNLTGLYHRGQPVGVYVQVYNAGIDQTTLRPAVDVEYALSKDGKEIAKQLEDWTGISDSGKRLTLARLLSTQALAPADYEVTIRVKDHVSGQALAHSAKFTVVP